MKNLIFIVALVVGFADTAFAETWLCIAEAQAGVTIAAPFDATLLSTSNSNQMIVINEKTDQVEFKNLRAFRILCQRNSCLLIKS